MELCLAGLILLIVLCVCYGLKRLWMPSETREKKSSDLNCRLTMEQVQELHDTAVKLKACRETLVLIHDLAAPQNNPRKSMPDIRLLCERALVLVKKKL